MESPEQEYMRISSAIVRRFRFEHGWSQEQLAAVSGVSLRTIQRVEATGVASMETWTCLAAAFGVERNMLAEPAVDVEPSSGAAECRFLPRYKIAAVAACVASVPAILGIENVLPAGTAWSALASAMLMLAIALLLYSGFGWYFGDGRVRLRGTRRVAGACFIAVAIFGVFSVLAMLTGTTL